MPTLRRWFKDLIPYRTARRIVIALIGGTLLLIGLALVVLPGPAFVVIPAGLAVLGVEFAWARRWLKKVRVRANELVSGMKNAYGSGAERASAAESAGRPPGDR